MNQHKQSSSKGILSRFRAALERFVFRKNHPGHLPHIPQAGQALPDPMGGISSEFTETKANVQHIFGSGIAFGTKEAVQIDENGDGREIIQEQSYRIGSGRIVNKVEDIAGICFLCEIVALKLLQDGLISIQEAHLRSMYDRNSAARCDVCGRNTCSVHCRPAMINNNIMNLCTLCLDQIQKQERRHKLVRWLLAPLIDPAQQKEETPR
jgi:hypothetical protein